MRCGLRDRSAARAFQRPGWARHLSIGRRRSPADKPRELLVGQLRADKIDRSSEQDIDARVARAPGNLGREPCLADARLAGHEDGRTAARLRCFERMRELP